MNEQKVPTVKVTLQPEGEEPTEMTFLDFIIVGRNDDGNQFVALNGDSELLIGMMRVEEAAIRRKAAERRIRQNREARMAKERSDKAKEGEK
jgi:hypothetical protein